MKKVYFLTLLSLLGMTQIVAQDDYLPLVREGVQWVNEKVIINHGDTTSYYYKYEFNGDDPLHSYSGRVFKACYYYTSNQLDIEKDSLIAGVGKSSRTFIAFFRNAAMWRVYAQDRNLMDFWVATDGGTTDFYPFTDEEDWGYDCIRFYIECQREPLLNTENFTENEPMMIEGVSCNRYAYVNEQGDTLAYVVEGIGFDSYEMGDLLTPFTLKPDPNADYQEYCGLSHVIKDGKIIYKGMRYREDQYTGIGEVAADQRRLQDGNYYDLMGRSVGTSLPTMPGIYIHHGKKIVVR